MRSAGFQVEGNPVVSVAPRAPPARDLAEPHLLPRGVIDGYAQEGHVPATAVLRLSGERPAGVWGLAVPAMPIGSRRR